MRIVGLQPGKGLFIPSADSVAAIYGALVLQILAIVFCGVGMLLSAIWAAWLAGLMKPREAAELVILFLDGLV